MTIAGNGKRQRRKISPRRHNVSQQVTCINEATGAESKLTLTAGFRDDGTVGEIFVDGNRSGSELETELDDTAILVSYALQSGMDLPGLIDRLQGSRLKTLLKAALSLEGQYGEQFRKISREKGAP